MAVTSGAGAEPGHQWVCSHPLLWTLTYYEDEPRAGGWGVTWERIQQFSPRLPQTHQPALERIPLGPAR